MERSEIQGQRFFCHRHPRIPACGLHPGYEACVHASGVDRASPAA